MFVKDKLYIQKRFLKYIFVPIIYIYGYYIPIYRGI